MKSEFGLLISNKENTGSPIPLLGVKAEGQIMGRGARVRVLQRFRNQESKAVEAIYKFPLPEGAAICGFKAHIGDRVIEGKVEEKEKAFEIYDKALIEGHGGYLLDEERPNIFTLSVGNLNPGSEVLVELEYVTLLDGDGAAVRFFLPTTIVGCLTVREADGLAISSRNRRLAPPDREKAPRFCAILSSASSAEAARHQLRAAGFDVDYVEDREGRRLAAVRLGGVRLIDNVPLDNR